MIREHHQNPDLLFVGTEFGVHLSIDGGENWTELENDLPTTPVHDLKIHPRENDIIVATHGRGIYIADIAPLVELTADVLARDAFLFQPESKVRWVAADRTNYSSSNFAGESEPDGVPLYYYLQDDADDVSVIVYQGNLAIAEIEATAEAGLHEVLWGMDKRIERSEEEIEALRARGGGRGGRGGGRGGFGRGGRGDGSPEDRLRYEVSNAPIGEYRVVLSVDGQEMERRVSILRDEWWEERR